MSLESITEGRRPGEDAAPSGWGENFPELPENVFDPQLDLCLVARAIPKEETKGGIIIPDKVADADRFLNQIGKIVAVGPLWYERRGMKELKDSGHPIPKVGDVVLHDIYAGNRLKFEGVEGEFLELNDQMIKAVIRDHDWIQHIKLYA